MLLRIAYWTMKKQSLYYRGLKLMCNDEQDLKARNILDNWRYLDKRLERWEAGYNNLTHECQEWVESRGITSRSILTNGSDYFALSISQGLLYTTSILFNPPRLDGICVPLNLNKAADYRVI